MNAGIYAQAFSREQITYTQGSPRNSEEFQHVAIHTKKSAKKKLAPFWKRCLTQL